MPRQPRSVVPGVPHHVTQRGSRRQPIFFNDEGRSFYVRTLAHYCRQAATTCLCWCLMENHIHLLLVPSTEDGLRKALAPTHTRYSNAVNRREGWTGSLFEGRFYSYPTDEAHMMVAARYIENNPVAAGLVEQAQDWRWSSARAHVDGLDDGLTDVDALGRHVGNWRAMLRAGLEAGEEDTVIETALRRGRLPKK